MVFPPFKASFLKITRAERHLAEVREAVRQFTSSATLIYIEEDVPNAPHMVHYRSGLSHQLPDEVPLIIGDVVHNLRAALDLMVCDIARLRGKNASEMKFPFAENEVALKLKLEKDAIKKLGSDVIEALISLSPYKGGNIALRGLHDLDITDKHKLIIPTTTYGEIGVNTEFFYISPQKLAPGAASVITRRDTPKDQVLMDAKGSWSVSFFEMRSGPFDPPVTNQLPFAGEPVIDVLEGLLELTREIVAVFNEKFGRATNPGTSPN